MSELKSCPFCGGKPRIDTEYDMDGFGNFHKVECTSCGASSKAHFCTQGNECPQYYQEVRDEWQQRQDDALTERVKELKEAFGKLKVMAMQEREWRIEDSDLGNCEAKESMESFEYKIDKPLEKE